MRYTAIILDDEKSACQVLESMISEYCPEIEIVLVTQDPFLALEQLESLKPQVLFIDINMPKMSGFEVLEKMNDYSIKVIFTTAYDKYAIKAFKYAAFDYLLKPIHVEHLEDTMKRLLKEFDPKENENAANNLLDYAKSEESMSSTTIAIHNNGDMKFLQKDSICYLEASGNYTTVFSDDDKFLTSKTLKEYEGLLDQNVFLRVHKSYMVNMGKVEKYSPKEGGYLLLQNGKKVSISRRKKQLLKQFSF